MRLFSILLLLAAASEPRLADVHTRGDVLDAFRARSRVRVVNVWATWCAPCVAEIGDLQRIASDFEDKSVEVVGVSLDDAIPGDRAASKLKVQRFLAARSIRFRNVYYVGPPSELADELRFDGTIPITIVYDRNGRELARNEGKLDVPWFRKTLAGLAQAQGGTK